MNAISIPCILELNDCEIRVANHAGIILRSPGIAVLDKEDLHLGEEAVKKAYLNPRATYNRYWHKMNQDALPTANSRFRHHADLVYTHLLKIHEQAGTPSELFFAVPGSYSAEQLSMLLGIASACPFNAVGLVDVAVASAAAMAVAGEYQHIDIHLHQMVITRVQISDSISRTAVASVAELGLNKIYSSTAGLIADMFIQQSRFDPLHHAETEQSLYDQLPDCLQTLRDEQEVLLEIRYRDTTHHARLTRDALLGKLQPLYEKINSHLSPDYPCLVGDRLAGLPGFTDTLPDYVMIDPEAVFASCRKFAAQIRSPGPELSFITSLPAQATIAVSRSAPPRTERVLTVTGNVTHVLHRLHAYPISGNTTYLSINGAISLIKPGDAICTVAFNNEGVGVLTRITGEPVYINGKSITKSVALHPGDRVHCENSGADFQFIRVVSGHGPS